jgi:hypothetical protein
MLASQATCLPDLANVTNGISLCLAFPDGSMRRRTGVLALCAGWMRDQTLQSGCARQARPSHPARGPGSASWALDRKGRSDTASEAAAVRRSSTVDPPAVVVVLPQHVSVDSGLLKQMCEDEHWGWFVESRLPSVRWAINSQAVSRAIKQPHFPLGLLGDAPVEHAQHGRDTNAATDQHDRLVATVQIEMPGRRAYLQHIAYLNIGMQVRGRTPRRKRCSNWCCSPLDGYAVVTRVWRIRKRITPCQHARLVVWCTSSQVKRQKLPGQEGWQGLFVHRCQVKGANVFVGILERFLNDLEFAKTLPSQPRCKVCFCTRWRRLRHCADSLAQQAKVLPVLPKTHAQKDGQLSYYTARYPEQQCGGCHVPNPGHAH